MSDLTQEQNERAAVIAAAWYQALADHGEIPGPSESVQPELLTLIRQIITLSSEDQVQPEAVRAIGERLARLGYKRLGDNGNAPATLSHQLSQENSTHTRLGNVLSQVIIDLMGQPLQSSTVDKEYAFQALQAGRKHLSANHHEFEQKDLAILQSLPDSLGIVDREGDIQYFHAGSEHVSIPNEKIQHKNIREYLSAELAEELLSIFRSVIDTRQTQVHEYSITFEKIGTRYFQDKITPFLANNVLVIGRDVTKQKHVEENLRASEARYRSVVEDQTGLIARWKPDGTLTFVNKAVSNFIGLEYEQLIGLNFNLILQPIKEDKNSKLFSSLEAITPEHPIAQGQTQVLVTPGTPRWLEWRTRAIFDENGQVTEYQTVANDITEIKQAQDELRDSEARYRSVVEIQTEFIGRFKPDGTITFLNKAAQRLLGFPPEVMIGHSIFEIVPEVGQMLAQGAVAYADILTPQKPSITDNLRATRADGKHALLEIVTQAIFNAQGEVIEFQTTGRDVTELKRIEAALRESEERYRSVVEGQTELIVRFLVDSTITFVNEAFCSYFSKTRQEILGSSALHMVYEGDKHYIAQALENLQNNSSIDLNKPYQTRVILANGEIRWLESIASAITRPDGSFSEFQVVARDITDLKLAQETLEQQNELLRQLNDQLINVQEIERQRIARDLHDSVLNELGAMMIAPAEMLTPKVVRDNYEQLIEQLRLTINGLRSPMLNYGLYAALEDLYDRMMDNPLAEDIFTMEVAPSQERFDSNVELHLFRIIQQACDNALQHAQAHHIRVYGQVEKSRVNITVADDGIGFRLETETDLVNVLAQKHFGLVSMLERGKLIGAEVQIDTRPGAGTQVRVLWEA